VIEDKVDKPYYIIIGRESGKDGIYTKYHSKVELPDCMLNDFPDDLTASTRAWVNFKVEQVLEERRNNFDNTPSPWAYIESSAIHWLTDYILEKKYCCGVTLKSGQSCDGCIWTDNEMMRFLEDNGFLKFEINILNRDTAQYEDQSCACDDTGPPLLYSSPSKSKGSSVNVSHHARKIYEFEFGDFTYKSNFESLRNDDRINSCPIDIYVGSKSDFCQDPEMITRVHDSIIVYFFESRKEEVEQYKFEDVFFIKVYEIEDGACLNVPSNDFIDIDIPLDVSDYDEGSYPIEWDTVISNAQGVYIKNGFTNINFLYGGSSDPYVPVAYCRSGNTGSLGGETTTTCFGAARCFIYPNEQCNQKQGGCTKLERSFQTGHFISHEVLHGLIDMGYAEFVHGFMIDWRIDEIQYPSFRVKTQPCLFGKFNGTNVYQGDVHFDDNPNLNSHNYEGITVTNRDRGEADIMLPVHNDLLTLAFKIKVINSTELKNNDLIQLLMIFPFMHLYDNSFPNGIIEKKDRN